MLSLLALFLAVAGASAGSSSLLPGPCPTPPAVSNFNATAFLGIWFDQAHTKRGTGLKLRCDLNRFISQSSNKFTFHSYVYSSATKKSISEDGDVEILSGSSNSGKLQFSVPHKNAKGEVKVISTDYSTFAVLWSCAPVDNMHFEHAVVMTREKHASSAVVNAGKKVLENNGLSDKHLSDTSHHKCPEYHMLTTTGGSSDPLGAVTSLGALVIPESAMTSTTTPGYRG